MTQEWSLDYECLDEVTTVPTVHERSIEQTLKRLDGTQTFFCGLTNVTDQTWLVCRGCPDEHIVEYVSSPVSDYSDSGSVASCIFLLSRKNPVDRHASMIRWKSNPDVWIDAPRSCPRLHNFFQHEDDPSRLHDTAKAAKRISGVTNERVLGPFVSLSKPSR